MPDDGETPDHFEGHIGANIANGYLCDQKERAMVVLRDIAEAAQAFVATTSVFQQRRCSRDEFEALALALIEFNQECQAKP